ncbi:MAG: diguanylate cyclase (GGDEF)-like protein [Paraglaciecola sp.]|jgi:diguanylate cyclase (GGDEF)-like protein
MSDQQQVNIKMSPRLSLTTIFNVAFISVLLIFFSITALTYTRLVEFRHILDEIANTSLPDIVVLEQLNNNLASLSTISNGLSHAKTEPSLRIAEAKIEDKLREIRLLAEQQMHDQFLYARLNTIGLELSELRELSSERLHIEQQLSQHENFLYRLYEQVGNLSIQTHNPSNVSDQEKMWRANFFEAVTIASRGLNSPRLQTVRQLSFKVSVLLDNLNIQTDDFSNAQGEQYLGLSQQLENTLIVKNGIFPLRIKLLRLSGRVTGRGNFVHNLILDYSRLLNFKSYQLSDSVITQTHHASLRVKQQIQFLGLLVAAGLLFLILILFVIRHRVVWRLVKLNTMAQDQAIGKSTIQSITGNDEISDIAHALSHFAVIIQKQNKAMQALSLQDSLTATPNRRALNERLKNELQLAIRQTRPISLLMIDIDYFKPYNDNYGHTAGDKTLKRVANILAENLPRSTDFLARYEGQQFVCLLPDTNADGALKVAHTLLEKIKKAAIEHKYSPDNPLLTISLGVVTRNENDTRDADTLLKLGDDTLYAAKQNGRNRIACYEKLVD